MNTLNLDAFLDMLNKTNPDVRNSDLLFGSDGFSRHKLIEMLLAASGSMTNAGYTIMDMVRTSPNGKRDEGFALGRRDGSTWVTWCYVRDPGKSPDFFWGHYYDDERTAKADFYRRLAEEFSY